MPVKLYPGSTHTSLKHIPGKHIIKKLQNNLGQKDEIVLSTEYS